MDCSPQASLSMGFSRQELLEWIASPPAEALPNLGSELTSPESPALQAGSLPTEPAGKPQ